MRCQQFNTHMTKRAKADILERFGQRVRQLRAEQGYSQEGFAYACELDRSYIGGIERGERNVALKNIETIAETLGISLAELMEGV
jgi:transcriptional regulator with XRE-family HTH domain